MINQMKLDKTVKLSDQQLDEVAGGHGRGAATTASKRRQAQWRGATEYPTPCFYVTYTTHTHNRRPETHTDCTVYTHEHSPNYGKD